MKRNDNWRRFRPTDTYLLKGQVNLATTEEQLRWALTQPVPFVAVGR